MLIGHHELRKEFQTLADAGRLAHGYIFYGMPRVGKATFGRALANYLENRVFDWDSTHEVVLFDMKVIEPEKGKASIGIDHIREMRAFLSQRPNRSSCRTVIIDGGEYLTAEAENALLKTAEEPQAGALIILSIDDPERLLPTLQSRLPKIHFHGVSVREIDDWLRSIGAGKSAAEAARRCGGSPGLAWRMLKDPDFACVSEWAEKFAKMAPARRAAFIKEIAADERFVFGAFLETLVLHLFSDPAAQRKRPGLWHALMELRRNDNFFNLNPRLQLTALARHI